MKTKNQEEQLRSEVERFQAAGNSIGALDALDQLNDLNPLNATDWCLVGQLLNGMGEFAQAIDAFEHCLSIDPVCCAARHDLGISLYNLGDLDRAASLIEKVAIETGLEHAWLGLATIAPGVPCYSQERVRQIRETYARIVRERESPSPFASKAVEARHRGPIRIGYLSAHWNSANYMKPVWPLINAHDCEQFEFTLFDDSANQSGTWDWLTRKGLTRIPIRTLSNSELADRIRELGIDILVDLSAYSYPQRLGLFVHRAAKLQMAWFNMYATSGFREMDFIVGDHYVYRKNEKPFYSERFLELPVSYLTFQTNHVAPDVSECPLDKREQFTFGCLCSLYKITPQVIATWATILKQADDSRLLLANSDLRSQCNRQFLVAKFEELGVASDRIAFLPPASHFEFLKYYNEIDVALDTFPYNGGTTTMEAIWQGVPVLTFAGDRWASRTSQTILENAGLSAFVADSQESYVRLAVTIATDRIRQDSLRDLRKTLRVQLLSSSACDSTALARGMESLFLSIH